MSRTARVLVLGGVLSGAALLFNAGCGSSTQGGANPGGGAGHAGASGAAPAPGGGAGGGIIGTGGSISNGGSATNAGNAGNAGSSASGTGGLGYALGDSKTEACIAYSLAECTRMSECEGYPPDDCLSLTLSCPDALFSAGSTRTVAGLEACVNDLLTFPCEKVNVGELPACAAPGTRQIGDPCAFSSQCASLECYFNTRAPCATCTKVLALGEDCTAPNTACGWYQKCKDGICAPFTAADNPVRSVGQDCSMDGIICGPGSYCSTTTHLCVWAASIGTSCAGNLLCKDSYCSNTDKTCTAYPGLNQPCGVTAGDGFANACAAGLVCSTMGQVSGSCVPAPSAGQPCDNSGRGSQCEASAWCDFNQMPQTCVPRFAVGTACELNAACQGGMFCVCGDGTNTCTTQTCNVVHLAGESCGTPAAICHPGFTCTDGKCQPRDSQGTYGTCENP